MVYEPPLDPSTRTVVWLDEPALSNRLFKVIFAVGPVGMMEAVSVMLPANPFKLVNTILETPKDPDWNVRAVGEAEIEKSLTVTITETWELREPLVPTRVTLYTPGLAPFEFTVRIVVLVPLAGTKRLVRLNCQANPDGETEPVILTTPAKPLLLVIVTVDGNDELAVIVLELGFADIVKKGTWTVTVALWLRDPLVPVTLSK
jgi:hypothetical protein